MPRNRGRIHILKCRIEIEWIHTSTLENGRDVKRASENSSLLFIWFSSEGNPQREILYLRIQSRTWQLGLSNQKTRNPGNRPMRVREITLWGQRQILYLRMPAPIREQGMPVLDQSECDNKAKVENRLWNGKSPKRMENPQRGCCGEMNIRYDIDSN